MKIDKKKKETKILTEDEKALRDKLYKLLESLPPEPSENNLTEALTRDATAPADPNSNSEAYYRAIGEK